MDRLTVAEKIDVLMQIMSCAGSYPLDLGCIAHDAGLSITETAALLLISFRQHPEIKHNERGFYIDED